MPWFHWWLLLSVGGGGKVLFVDCIYGFARAPALTDDYDSTGATVLFDFHAD